MTRILSDNSSWILMAPKSDPLEGGRRYYWTENYYIINSETILDANNYITFSIINSQRLM